MRSRSRSSAAALALALAGPCCGAATSSLHPPAATPQALRVLFMGNSHTAYHELPEMVAAMVRAVRPGRTVVPVEAPGWMFLDERAVDPASLRLLTEGRWDLVVLQAQKYSSSGRFEHSTEGAESLIRRARAAHAVPILFPEWPRRGVRETERIHDLHVSIARREPACVAPVGQAWDLARTGYPDLLLHAGDGNHSAPAGAFLTALVLAATITGASPHDLPFLPQFGVSSDVQLRLRDVAAEAVLASPPRAWCPADPPA